MTKLEELKAAYEAATKGEWDISRHATPESHPQYGVYAEGQQNDLAIVRGDANAQFIALAHNAMPVLLEAVEQFLPEPPGGDLGVEIARGG